MNNIRIAKETIAITKQGYYENGGKRTELPGGDHCSVTVYPPDKGAELISRTVIPESGDMCSITVTNEDSFQAAARFERPFVMNFANAHSPGGGFLLGANAQEEALCRCSTLYASISSEKAAEMYKFNNTHISRTESDYMLLSEDVCVFRNERCELLGKPFTAAVITLPAPNRYGAALLAPEALIQETMTRRIRIMLCIAAAHGYKALVLGAWGCGAFGNPPEKVSGYFRQAFIDEGYGKLFGNICFAVYGSENGKNISAFRKTFSEAADNVQPLSAT